MHQSKSERNYRKGKRVLSVLTAGLLAVVLAGCGNPKETAGDSDRIRESVKTVESEGSDAEKLMEMLEGSMGDHSRIQIRGIGEINGTAVMESGSYPVKSSLYYELSAEDEAAQSSIDIQVSRDDGTYGSRSSNEEFVVMAEDGQAVSYVRDGYYDWTKTSGDYLGG